MPLGRLLIILGLVLVAAGLLLTYTNFFPSLRLGRLPGDISIKRENFSFYFPITTCILVSLVLTLIFYLLRK
jgi:formate hydrogenlyase subunit 3/multisubunit Na+/H+ antiporter MnhD subunit